MPDPERASRLRDATGISPAERAVLLDARRFRAVALTRAGKSLLKRSPLEKTDSGQSLYVGFVKPREIVHDTALYRMHRAEADRIERDGGQVRRVVLDFELKKRAYSPLAKAQDLPPP